MVSMRLFVFFGLGLFCFSFLGACTHVSQGKKDAIFAHLSEIGILSEQSKRALDVDSSKKYGIYRAIVPITVNEAEAIKIGQGSQKWEKGPIPEPIWHSIIMIGSDRTIPDRFIPVYTNSLLFSYAEEGVYRRIYVLDVQQPSRPLLCFVSTDIR